MKGCMYGDDGHGLEEEMIELAGSSSRGDGLIIGWQHDENIRGISCASHKQPSPYPYRVSHILHQIRSKWDRMILQRFHVNMRQDYTSSYKEEIKIDTTHDRSRSAPPLLGCFPSRQKRKRGATNVRRMKASLNHLFSNEDWHNQYQGIRARSEVNDYVEEEDIEGEEGSPYGLDISLEEAIYDFEEEESAWGEGRRRNIKIGGSRGDSFSFNPTPSHLPLHFKLPQFLHYFSRLDSQAHDDGKRRISPLMLNLKWLTKGVCKGTDHIIKLTKLGLNTKSRPASQVPRDVPKGSVAVYVGEEQQRFVIPVLHLNHPFFNHLLEEMENQFGFYQEGALLVPCQVPEFVSLQSRIEKKISLF